MKLIKSIICLLVISIFLVGATQKVMAVDTGLNTTAKEGYGEELYGKINPTDPNKAPTIPNIIGAVVGALLAFIGILFFILIIYGGFLWMTSWGNEQEVKKAKDLIISATIGLVIVLAAYAITAYIGTALTTTG